MQKRFPSHSDIQNLFDGLLSHYGELNWWPSENPFEVIVGAILTQNTGWKNAQMALLRMRNANILNIHALKITSPQRLAQVIIPSGYYNQKARKLKIFVDFVYNEFGGDLNALLALETPKLRQKLLNLWGIGYETADDIILYAAGKPIFVIDAYTKRLVQRLGWRVHHDNYASYQNLFTRALPPRAPVFNKFHALIDHHSSTICRKTPLCHKCPLKAMCFTGQQKGRK